MNRCKGMNCGCTDGVSHSLECHAEHAAFIAGGVFVKSEQPATNKPHPMTAQVLDARRNLAAMPDGGASIQLQGTDRYAASEPEPRKRLVDCGECATGCTEGHCRKYQSKPEPQAQAGEPLKLGLWDSQWVNIVNDPSLRDMDKEEAVNYAVKMAERKCIENAHEALAKKDAALKADIAAFDQIGGLCRALRTGGPAPQDLEGLSDALQEAVDTAHAAITQGQEALR